MILPRIAILHYTAPPVIGGVEAVIEAHARVLGEKGYPVTIVAGRGDRNALPAGTDLLPVPAMDSQHPEVTNLNWDLERGQVPPGFDGLTTHLKNALAPILASHDIAILHNLFTKHFNLALTAALYQLLEEGGIGRCIAWCHDISWTSPHSRPRVHTGFPWDLLRAYRPEVTYVAVSTSRQRELAGLYGCPAERIFVIYNGVDPQPLLGLSPEGSSLADRLGLLESDLVLLMPVRVTQAKNIEFALQVAAALKTGGLQFRLVVSGPPDPHDRQSMDYFSRLQELRRQLGVEAEMRFVFTSGPDPEQPYYIDQAVVGDLFRLADIMFMPSHREGFGMPVLEAGLAGVPVACSDIPAAVEVGARDVLRLDQNAAPTEVAEQILEWVNGSPVYRMRRRVRQNFTWQAIFRNQIEPLLRKGYSRNAL
jgi:glycosyltransferase involved in cell wall biosynthesis